MCYGRCTHPANVSWLKLDLLCQGMRIRPGCRLDECARPILRTRAGLGSGLEAILGKDVYVNIPVSETFAHSSPYELAREDAGYALFKNSRPLCRVTLPPRPRFYDRHTSSDKPMSSIGVLQGTYLGIYSNSVCDHWKASPPANCKFCSVGLNLGKTDASEKTVADVVETVKAARDEEGVTFVHFNTGYYGDDSHLAALEPFIEATVGETGLLIGVQCPPHPDLSRYARLRKLGVNNVSFCFELWNEDKFAEICPGKSTRVGKQLYLDAIEHCAPMFDTTNGEIIAGLEPVEDSISAIEWITSVGAIPTVCVFRPLAGTQLEAAAPPQADNLLPIFQRFYTACMDRNLPIGIAPNVKVSLVMLPEECRWLVDKPEAYFSRRLKLRAKRAAFGLYFRHRLRKHRKREKVRV